MENTTYLQQIEILKKRLLPASSVLIVTHDFPDPDCIAAAYGFQALLAQWQVKTSQIAFGGFVGRAENRAMMRYLTIQAVPLMLIDMAEFDRIILVDSFPGEGNVSLDPDQLVDVVIDHHPHTTPADAPFYAYIRKDLGSTSTIITQLLIAENVPFSVPLATALFYGIKTDTNHLSRNASSEDVASYKYLFNLIDHEILSRIEAPDRDAEYFRILHQSTESMRTFDNTIGYAHLGIISTPDYIAEITDLFHSLENLEWMICSAIFKNHIFFSIRSKNDETAGIKAGIIAKSMHGNGGGHSTKSAGQIPIKDIPQDQAVATFTAAFKSALSIKDQTGQSILR